MKASINVKLVIYVIVISIMCYFISYLFFYNMSSAVIIKNVQDTNMAQLQSVSGNIDFLMKNVFEEASLLADNENIQNLLVNYDKSESDKRSKLILKTEEILNNFIIKEKATNFIEIISDSAAKPFTVISTISEMIGYNYKELINIMKEKDFLWLNTSNNNVFNYLWPTQEKKTVLVKKIKNMADKKEIGMVLVFLRDSIFEEITSDMDINLHIINNNGIVIYQYGSLRVDEKSYPKGDFALTEGSTEENIGGRKYFVTNMTSGYTGWKLVGYMSMDDILLQLSNIRNLITIIVLACFMITVLFSLIVSYRIAKPVNNIEKLVIDIEKGNIDSDKCVKVSGTLSGRLLSNKYGIMLIYSIIIIVPVIISMAALYNVSYNYIRKQSIQSYRNRIEQLSKKVDINLLNFNNTASYLFGEKNLNKALLAFSSGKTGRDGFQAIAENIVSNIEKIGPGDLAVTLFNNKKEIIYFTSYKQRFLKDKLYNFDNRKINSTLWLPTALDCGTYLLNYGKKMIAFENFDNIRFYDNLGYIVLTLNEQFIGRIYESAVRNRDNVIFIIDPQGKIISHPDKNFIMSKAGEKYVKNINNNSAKNGYFITSKGKNDLVVVYSRLNTAEWIMVGEIPLRKLIAEVQRMKYYPVLLIFANIIIISLLILKFLSKINNRIARLNNAMQEVGAGNLEVKVDMKTGDEIQRLAEGFNSMVSRLKTLMEDNYNQGFKRKEAELNALQAQINPHFLYNTLESINWEAMMLTDGPNNVSKMVAALSDLLRLSISKGREIVTLEEEINHVKNYLIIQKERYSDKFEVEWDIDPKLYSYKTLKLILQPLVENAIYHGLELKYGKGLIIIRGYLFEKNIKLEIIDDGLGMSRERLDLVRESMNDYDNKNNRSIGIGNVNERIQLYFGKEYGIKIFSEEGSGTKIEIYLPLLL